MKLKCPNPDCDATDHEPGAKYCHKCGTELENVSSASSHSGEKAKPKSIGWISEITKGTGSPTPKRQRSLWINNDWETSTGVSSLQKFRWGNPVRYVLLLTILAECIYFSIPEYRYFGGFGLCTILLVNIVSFICTLAECFPANKGDFDDKNGFWGLYYRWLHFFLAAIIILLGYLIVCHIQSIFTIVLDMVLSFVLLLADFETFEDFFDGCFD